MMDLNVVVDLGWRWWWWRRGLNDVVGCLVDLDVDDGGRGGCHPSGWGALEELFHLIVPHWCRWRPRSAAQGVHGVLEGVGDISWGLRAGWGAVEVHDAFVVGLWLLLLRLLLRLLLLAGICRFCRPLKFGGANRLLLDLPGDVDRILTDHAGPVNIRDRGLG